MSYLKIGACVLILVLMDNQNTFEQHEPHAHHLVLILVLMDNQNTFFFIMKKAGIIGLNPCSNG